jgi:hypothetical protein
MQTKLAYKPTTPTKNQKNIFPTAFYPANHLRQLCLSVVRLGQYSFILNEVNLNLLNSKLHAQIHL